MRYKDCSIKIKYKGRDYWFLQEEDGGGAIAHLKHCNEKGNLITLGISFAHVYPNREIRRYGQKIGRIDDFIINNKSNIMSNPHDDNLRDKLSDEQDERDFNAEVYRDGLADDKRAADLERITEFVKKWWNDSLKVTPIVHPFTYIAERILETPLNELLETETNEEEAKRKNNEV